MGYASKKEYDMAARVFAEANQLNPKAVVHDGIWGGKGMLAGTAQRAISFEGKTVILDKSTGQVIDFYIGTELRGLIDLVKVIVK